MARRRKTTWKYGNERVRVTQKSTGYGKKQKEASFFDGTYYPRRKKNTNEPKW